MLTIEDTGEMDAMGIFIFVSNEGDVAGVGNGIEEIPPLDPSEDGPADPCPKLYDDGESAEVGARR